MMICPNCGHVAKETDRFCVRCATKLIDETAAAEAAAAEAAESVQDGVEAAAEELNEFAEPVINRGEFEPVPQQPEPVFTEPAPAEPVYAAPAYNAPAYAEPTVQAPEFAPEYAPEPQPAVEAPLPEVSVVREEAECCSKLDKPLTTWGFIWRILVFCIPIFSMIPLFVMAFASGINKNSRGFARAVLLLMLITLIVALIGTAVVLVIYNWEAISETIRTMFN